MRERERIGREEEGREGGIDQREIGIWKMRKRREERKRRRSEERRGGRVLGREEEEEKSIV